ncbi:MAG: methionyl-tRNA formyltransferase [Oscillospiraceae bacterium]|jgi:methionyl-tRNA formyltransferase|nr:methionyl-tRNA formyltransferase [Oscillospiraceae bacterium]
MNTVFMGTPDFAATILSGLVSSKHHVTAVFTQPDKPKGRGHELSMSPVKVLALKNNIPVLQPTTLKDEKVITQISNLDPDLIVVAAYGMLLPGSILKIPKYGCINVHGSLLPKYRGAAPIQWSIINGEKETGITIMNMEEELDHGDIICQEKIQIKESDTAASLYLTLAKVGKDALLHGIDLISSPEFIPQKQNDAEASFAAKLTKEMGNLNFNESANTILNLIRGLDIWPVARTVIAGQKVKIYKAAVTKEFNLAPNEIFVNKRLIIGCRDLALELLEIQPENGKRMTGAAFVNGLNGGN